MRKRVHFIGIAALLGLGSTALAQDVQEAPAAPAASVASVEEIYGPPPSDAELARAPAPPAIPDPLDLAAALASRTHPLVDAAQAEIEAREAEYRGARWQHFPNLSVEALAATRGSSFADRDGLAVNAVIEQPLWSGGRIEGQIDRAGANLRAGEARLDEAEQDLVLRVVQAYYDYVLASERQTVLDASLADHTTLLEAISRRVDREVSPEADLTLGRSRTAQVEFELSTSNEAVDSARLRLRELTGGVEVDPILPPPGVAATLPPEDVALAEALACSPGLQALNDLIDVAEADRSLAKAQLWPQLLLQLSQNEITGARAALVLRAQTGNGLSLLTAIDASDARVRRALADFGELERRLREALRRDYVLVAAAQKRIDSGVIAADAAAEIIASYQRQFIAGRRSWLDVMNAVRESANARLSESNARVTAAAATARILSLSCRWQPEGAELAE